MRSRPRGFTMIEMLLAGVIAAFVLGAVSMSLGQLAAAKNGARQRLEAYLRADAALSDVRSDVISVLRRSDLFWTRMLINDGSLRTPIGETDRDEILVFDSRPRPIRDEYFIGEGGEFETQYRIETDELGPALWKRRDAVLDEYPLGGGLVTPVAENVVSLSIEAYDGDLWYDSWDSDYDGLPLAVRITIVASGAREGRDVFAGPLATLRTVVPIDRVPLPSEMAADVPQEGAEGDIPDEALDALDQFGAPPGVDLETIPGTTGGPATGGAGGPGTRAPVPPAGPGGTIREPGRGDASRGGDS